jgi:hypothetical protein
VGGVMGGVIGGVMGGVIGGVMGGGTNTSRRNQSPGLLPSTPPWNSNVLVRSRIQWSVGESERARNGAALVQHLNHQYSIANSQSTVGTLGAALVRSPAIADPTKVQMPRSSR